MANLWNQTVVFFNLPEATPADCGTFSYRLFESISGNDLDPSLFVINSEVSIPFLKFTLPQRDPWLFNSPFTLTLEATYSTFGPVQSDELEVTVFDTCLISNYTQQVISQMTTYVNAP